MASNSPSTTLSADRINDRAVPRWRITSIACTLLSEGKWHEATILDISLGGAKVCAQWDLSRPIMAVSLTGAAPFPSDMFLVLGTDVVWVDPVRNVAALHFDVPDRRTAANLLAFLSNHIADSSAG